MFKLKTDNASLFGFVRGIPPQPEAEILNTGVIAVPIIEIHMLEGRSVEKKRALAAEITETVCRCLDAKPETVRVIIDEMPKQNYAIAGELVCDRDAKP